MRLRLKQLAQIADVNVETVRYYQRRNLLPRVTGSPGAGKYSETHVERLLLIRSMQSLGFTLKEIQVLVESQNRIQNLCDLTRQALARKMEELQAEVARLERNQIRLTCLMKKCKACTRGSCDIMNGLSKAALLKGELDCTDAEQAEVEGSTSVKS
ncbi:MAG TPA: MerR family transcriptional regulator [Bdellovibrionales bacterium]|nr:MerR family transcriptional regulator [Bdellovibrionales bacterium]